MTRFVDTTLRDGCQAPSALLDSGERYRLAIGLADSGFKELEAGIPARGEDEIAFLRSLEATGARIVSWCRAKKGDLEAAARAGTGAVHISGALNGLQLSCMGMDRAGMEGAMLDLLRAAKREFDHVSLGIMDACRTDDDILAAFIPEALSWGAGRIRLADSVGTATPRKVEDWARRFRAFLPKLEFHAHNDLGMATANAVTAAHAGFGAVSATVAGLGERAGNACWEETATALALERAECDAIDLPRLFALSRSLRAALREAIPPRQPLLGEHAFAHESGIHVAALGRDGTAFQFCRPETLGLPAPRILFGPQSGTGGIMSALGERGLRIDRAEAGRLLGLVSALAMDRGRALESDELLELARGEWTAR